MSAGLGNLGVSAMQFIVPIVITMGLFGARNSIFFTVFRLSSQPGVASRRTRSR